MQLLQASSFSTNGKRKLTKVEIPELDGYVMIRELTGEDQLALDSAKKQHGDDEDNTFWTVKVLEMCVCDDDGNRLFGSFEAAKELMQMPTRSFTPFMNRVLIATGLVDDLQEDSEKN